ncbi:hypothetical protein ASPBRDRAFT_317013 [Aspergillus brasiliensis CBS 101740]|uniref:Uncharacterized protein n=1 Tax=Aspergillus brasiliensis (strain CBS 101740 / IMI 381727 / IBT 21946) TaxID=767769 RepID=A0A1L9U947_ASPBC|nr:hypothetical protein ASPBRDRAFT_317013 [Aspergillus brasiliensis CBS 101740]
MDPPWTAELKVWPGWRWRGYAFLARRPTRQDGRASSRVKVKCRALVAEEVPLSILPAGSQRRGRQNILSVGTIGAPRCSSRGLTGFMEHSSAEKGRVVVGSDCIINQHFHPHVHGGIHASSFQLY